MILEICASNYQSAINAQKAGAHRIELCTELAVGGLTPSFGLLKEVLKSLTIPVFVLIRPRSGNFTYTESEFEIMKQDIKLCKELGCKGIVSGVLNPDFTIDKKRTKELIDISSPLDFTFHRAFDWTPNPILALATLIELKVKRVLTSGQQPSAFDGFELLNKLKLHAKENIIILPGGGIDYKNAQSFKLGNFKELHASATKIKSVNDQPIIPMNSDKFYDETIEIVSDKTLIKNLLNSIKL